jgi:hypothetical protein
MYKEAGEDPHKAIEFITLVSNQPRQFDDKEEDKDKESSVKTIFYAKDEPVEDDRGLDTEVTQEGANKTQGSLTGAQQKSLAGGVFNKPATEAGGDKEGVQSTSVAPGG